MAYVRRISDNRVFEVFGVESQQHLIGRDVVTAAYFFLFDEDVTEDEEGNLCVGLWQWHLATHFVPLELLEQEDFELEEDEQEDKL